MVKLAQKKIQFVLKYDIELGQSINYATLMTHKFRLDPGEGWFYYKPNSAGLKYEFYLAVYTQITLVSGPYKQSTHDITVFVVEIPMKTREIGTNMC